jgi:chloramphenicol 3-O-phosphotransferase
MIIFLNGCSSSGKSSIANALQYSSKQPMLHLGIDTFFQMMESIEIIRCFKGNFDKPIKEFITNLNKVLKKIILLMGKNVCHIYGL